MAAAKGGGAWCAANNCTNSRKKGWRMFRFPKDVERCKKWTANTGREDLLLRTTEYVYKNCFLCSDHFEDNQFMNSSKQSLIWCAVPTLFLDPNPPPKMTRKRPLPSKRAGPREKKTKKSANYMGSETGTVQRSMMDPVRAEGSRLTLLPIDKDQKPFRCGLCSFSFDTIEELHSHISRHSLTKPFQCGYCLVSYDTSSELIVHVDSHHLFVCVAKGSCVEFCETDSTENSAQVKNNTSDLKAKETYSGDLGDSDFCAEVAVSECVSDEGLPSTSRKKVNSKQQQKATLSIKFPIKKMAADFSCPFCTQTFKLQADLKKHSITDHGDDRPFHCSRCPSRFKQKNHLTDHLNSVHRSHKPYACPFCGDRFKIRSYLKHHMSRKHQVDSISSSSAQSKSKHDRESMDDTTNESDGTCSPRKKAIFISDSYLSYGNTEFEIADRKDIEFGNDSEERTSDAAGDGGLDSEDEALPHSFMTTSLSAESNTVQTAAMSQVSVSWNSAEGEQGIKVELDSDVADCHPVKSEKADAVSAYAAPVMNTSETYAKLYKCGVCDSTFSSPTHVGDHWQNMHATCSLCGEWFSGPLAMNNHQKYCHGQDEKTDMPFICGICGTKFRMARYVREHIRKFHKKTHVQHMRTRSK